MPSPRTRGTPASSDDKALEEATKVLGDAKRHSDAGDDAGAKRMLKISMSIHPIDEAKDLLWRFLADSGMQRDNPLSWTNDNFCTVGNPKTGIISRRGFGHSACCWYVRQHTNGFRRSNVHELSVVRISSIGYVCGDCMHTVVHLWCR